jgi:hypothetical protein
MAGSIFCDLEKAFDSVNHDALLSKLPYYEERGKAKLLLKSYLQNRHQKVQIISSYLNSDTISEWTKINVCGFHIVVLVLLYDKGVSIPSNTT